MQKTILFCTFLLAAHWLGAQFAGGSGDGVDRRQSLQLDLTGVPSGVRPLYAGGRGDGYVAGRAYGSLDTPVALFIFGGGAGDGYARDAATGLLAGEDLASLYGGGPGDGFDRSAATVTPGGQPVTILYSGGNGDGYADRRTAALTPGGTSLAQVYGGGEGDGHARLTAAELLGLAMTMLYGGGPGDGHDRRAATLALDGSDLSTLFAGGGGDGTDRSLFFGVLPLPLTLVRFDAFPEENYVLLRWVTEDEVATDFFTIEKTRDGRDYDWVGETLAAGYSAPGTQLTYVLKDEYPDPGLSYYRLKTTDFDGTVSLSHLIEVQYAAPSDWKFDLFPNPNTGRHFNLRIDGLPGGERLQLEIIDAAGRVIHREALVGDRTAVQRFDLRNRLSAGSYLIRLLHPQRGMQVKLLIVGD